MDGSNAHHSCHHRTERSFASNRKHGHCELALGKIDLAIECVLSEGSELCEARPNRAGHSVEHRVVLTFRFIEPLGVKGELVPEPVEINAFAASHKAFHVGAAKAKLPHAGVLNDLLPRPYSGKRCVDGYEAGNPIREPYGESITNHVSDVMGYKISTKHAKSIHHACHVEALRLLVVPSRRLGRQPEATQIGHDDGMVCCKYGSQRSPHIAGCTKAVQQYHGRPLAADACVDCRTV